MKIAFQPIPSSGFLAADVIFFRDQVFKDSLTRESGKILKVFEKTVSTFDDPKHIPAFERTKIKRVGLDLEIHAGALKNYSSGGHRGSVIYSVLNFGSLKPIVIGSGRRPMKFIAINEQPKTHPSRPLRPTAGRRVRGLTDEDITESGMATNVVTTRSVQRDIDPRRFDIAIAKHRRPYFVKVMRTNMRKAKKRFWWRK